MLSKEIDKTPPSKAEKPTEEDLRLIANEMVVLVAEGAAEKNTTIQKAYQFHEKNYSPNRDLNQILILSKEAYKFVNENWGFISSTVWLLRELGYLDIENHPTIKSILDKLRKKGTEDKKETKK